jgi:hypothetical protein
VVHERKARGKNYRKTENVFDVNTVVPPISAVYRSPQKIGKLKK